MSEEARRLVAQALQRSSHAPVRSSLGRAASGGGLAELYAAAGEAVRAMATGHQDAVVVPMLAKAINATLARAERTRPLDRISACTNPGPPPVATSGRPALLRFPRDRFDGRGRESTLVLPPKEKVVEPTEAFALEFFAPKPAAAPPPPMRGKHFELEGDGAPEDESAFEADTISAALDNIAMLARHRRERRQRDRDEDEQAILANLDAISACGGDCVRAVVEWWRERRTPYGTWAATFTLASFDGIDALQGLARELEELPADGALAHAAADALVAAPHAHVPDLGRELLESPNPAARAVAVELLARKRQVGHADVQRHLCDPNLPVLEASLRAASTLPREHGIPLLLPMLGYPQQTVAWLAARQLALWGRPEPYFQIKNGQPGALGEYALEVLVMFGEASDLDVVEALVASEPVSGHILSAIGRFGHAQAWAYLIHALENPELADHAATALVTLFGDRVAAGSRKNAAAWRAAIAEGSFDEGVRYRRGEPWRLRTVAAECRGGLISSPELHHRLDELAVRTGMALDLEDGLWWRDVYPTLDLLLQKVDRADHGFAAGGWACASTGFR